MVGGNDGMGPQGDGGGEPAAQSRRDKTTAEAEVAKARRELRHLDRRVALAEDQFKARRQIRLKHGIAVESDDERKMRTQIYLIKLRRKNVRRWLYRQSGRRTSESIGAKTSARESAPRPAKAKANGNSKKSKPKKSKKRSNGAGSRKKLSRNARYSPSRGISSTTGKRSRATLIG